MLSRPDHSFPNRENIAAPAGLFDRIIAAIHHEEQLRKTRRIFLAFLFLLVFSIVLLPFTFYILVTQWQDSGVAYFISAALQSWYAAPGIWQDSVLSVLESLPIVGMSLFLLNLASLLFVVRLFLYRRGLLIQYALKL